MSNYPTFIEPPRKEVFYCPVQTREASWYVDPEPAEFCENEVANEGDLCARHDVCCTGPASRRCEDCQ